MDLIILTGEGRIAYSWFSSSLVCSASLPKGPWGAGVNLSSQLARCKNNIPDRSPVHHRKQTHKGMEEMPTPARIKPRTEPLLHRPKTQNRNGKFVIFFFLQVIFSEFMRFCIVFNIKVYSVCLLVLLVKAVGERKTPFENRKKNGSGFYFSLLATWLPYHPNVVICKDTRALLRTSAGSLSSRLSKSPPISSESSAGSRAWMVEWWFLEVTVTSGILGKVTGKSSMRDLMLLCYKLSRYLLLIFTQGGIVDSKILIVSLYLVQSYSEDLHHFQNEQQASEVKRRSDISNATEQKE